MNCKAGFVPSDRMVVFHIHRKTMVGFRRSKCKDDLRQRGVGGAKRGLHGCYGRGEGVVRV